MKVSTVLESCLYAADLPEAARFYREVLGLEQVVLLPERHAFFRCGEAMVLLFNPHRTAESESGSKVPTHGAHGPGHLAFRVNDAQLEPWRERLQSFGVPIEAEMSWPQGGYSIYFRDPAGNSLELATGALWGLP